MSHFSSLALLLILTMGCWSAQAEPSAILNYVEHQLPHSGVLEHAEGFVYVKVDDEYIHKLVTFIQEEGFEEPPYCGEVGLVGAHISVIYPDEVKQYGIVHVQECGKTIYFHAKECQVVAAGQGGDVYYVVIVEAPELEQIREKYGLPKRKYDFHITIGIRK